MIPIIVISVGCDKIQTSKYDSEDKEFCKIARAEWDKNEKDGMLIQEPWKRYLERYPDGSCSYEAKIKLEKAKENLRNNVQLMINHGKIKEASKPLF